MLDPPPRLTRLRLLEMSANSLYSVNELFKIQPSAITLHSLRLNFSQEYKHAREDLTAADLLVFLHQFSGLKNLELDLGGGHLQNGPAYRPITGLEVLHLSGFPLCCDALLESLVLPNAGSLACLGVRNAKGEWRRQSRLVPTLIERLFDFMTERDGARLKRDGTFTVHVNFDLSSTQDVDSNRDTPYQLHELCGRVQCGTEPWLVQDRRCEAHFGP